jgi:beta-phosphoglucomutase-like phosphatase (HAD superfamily)
VGIGTLMIPGVGPFIAAGPIIAALAGAGAAAEGLTGALIGMGMPEYEARQYEEKMKGGNILISVHTEDGAERTRVKEIFKNAGAITAAEDIVDRAYGTQSQPAREVVSPAIQRLRDPNPSEPDAAV